MSAKKMSNAPYGRLAEFYDVITAYAPKMNRHARRKALGPILTRAYTVCDLACGSGATSIDLARSGKLVFAVDLAPHFCRTLRARARREKLDITVVEGDMRSFRLPQPVDLVVCEFSALNNLDDRRGLAAVFSAVARALRPGGHFLVDVNTPKSFDTQCRDTSWFDTPQFKLVLHPHLDGDGRRVRLELEWFVPKGRVFQHEHETIVNVCWTDAEIRAALAKAGLKHVRTLDGVDVRPKMKGTVRGTDVYYLAMKPRTEGRRRS